MSIELNIHLLYWYFQLNQCLNIKQKHAVHNIHILAWDPRATSCPCVKTALYVKCILCWSVFDLSILKQILVTCRFWHKKVKFIIFSFSFSAFFPNVQLCWSVFDLNFLNKFVFDIKRWHFFSFSFSVFFPIVLFCGLLMEH